MGAIDCHQADTARLEVLVAAYGRDAMQRISTGRQFEPGAGLRYLISWQLPDEEPADIPATLTDRNDIKVVVTRGKGLSANRNNLLDNASAPYLLITDDDIFFEAEKLSKIIDTFDSNPDVDMALFKIDTPEYRPYPARETDLNYSRFKRNYYPYSMEIALRRKSIGRAGLRFDERYGINAPVLGSGEEDVFVYDAWKKDLRLRFFPVEILKMDKPTTIARNASDPHVVMARGAVLQHIYGAMAWPRLLRLALTMPGRTIDNFKLLVKGAEYERTTKKLS